MANDSISLLDHLGWKKAHIIGHSMGNLLDDHSSTMVLFCKYLFILIFVLLGF